MNWNTRYAHDSIVDDYGNIVDAHGRDVQHGKKSTYSIYGCRCNACKDAAKDYSKQYRENRPPLEDDDPRHGTANGYSYGCRCGDCTTANTDYSKQYKKKLREKFNSVSNQED